MTSPSPSQSPVAEESQDGEVEDEYFRSTMARLLALAPTLRWPDKAYRNAKILQWGTFLKPLVVLDEAEDKPSSPLPRQEPSAGRAGSAGPSQPGLSSGNAPDASQAARRPRGLIVQAWRPGDAANAAGASAAAHAASNGRSTSGGNSPEPSGQLPGAQALASTARARADTSPLRNEGTAAAGSMPLSQRRGGTAEPAAEGSMSPKATHVPAHQQGSCPSTQEAENAQLVQAHPREATTSPSPQFEAEPGEAVAEHSDEQALPRGSDGGAADEGTEDTPRAEAAGHCQDEARLHGSGGSADAAYATQDAGDEQQLHELADSLAIPDPEPPPTQHTDTGVGGSGGAAEDGLADAAALPEGSAGEAADDEHAGDACKPDARPAPAEASQAHAHADADADVGMQDDHELEQGECAAGPEQRWQQQGRQPTAFSGAAALEARTPTPPGRARHQTAQHTPPPQHAAGQAAVDADMDAMPPPPLPVPVSERRGHSLMQLESGELTGLDLTPSGPMLSRFAPPQPTADHSGKAWTPPLASGAPADAKCRPEPRSPFTNAAEREMEASPWVAAAAAVVREGQEAGLRPAAQRKQAGGGTPEGRGAVQPLATPVIGAAAAAALAARRMSVMESGELPITVSEVLLSLDTATGAPAASPTAGGAPLLTPHDSAGAGSNWFLPDGSRRNRWGPPAKSSGQDLPSPSLRGSAGQHQSRAHSHAPYFVKLASGSGSGSGQPPHEQERGGSAARSRSPYSRAPSGRSPRSRSRSREAGGSGGRRSCSGARPRSRSRQDRSRSRSRSLNRRRRSLSRERGSRERRNAPARTSGDADRRSRSRSRECARELPARSRSRERLRGRDLDRDRDRDCDRDRDRARAPRERSREPARPVRERSRERARDQRGCSRSRSRERSARMSRQDSGSAGSQLAKRARPDAHASRQEGVASSGSDMDLDDSDSAGPPPKRSAPTHGRDAAPARTTPGRASGAASQRAGTAAGTPPAHARHAALQVQVPNGSSTAHSPASAGPSPLPVAAAQGAAAPVIGASPAQRRVQYGSHRAAAVAVVDGRKPGDPNLQNKAQRAVAKLQQEQQQARQQQQGTAGRSAATGGGAPLTDSSAVPPPRPPAATGQPAAPAAARSAPLAPAATASADVQGGAGQQVTTPVAEVEPLVIEEPPNCKRVGDDAPIGMEPDLLGFMSLSMIQFSSSLGIDAPGVYSRNHMKLLAEEARGLKRKADNAQQVNGGRWTPLLLTLYLQSALKYMECAHGNELAPDRESSIRASNENLNYACNAVLATVSKEASRLIDQRLQQQQQGQGGPRGPYSTPELVVLEAIRLLSIKLTAICRSKWLMLNQEALTRSLSLIEEGPTGHSSGGGGGGSNHHGGSGHRGGGGGDDSRVQGSSQRGGGGGAGPHQAASPAAAADSVSSTREAAAAALSGATWVSSMQQVADSVQAFAAAGDMWRRAAVDSKAFCAATSREGADRGAQLAAARIAALGYEAGVWDLMGSVSLARKAVDCITCLPGMD